MTFQVRYGWLVVVFMMAGPSLTTALCRGQGSVGALELRPFVTGIVPVAGNGTVGGISIDAKGVVTRTTTARLGTLGRAWRKALKPLPTKVDAYSPRRKISLRGLEREILRHIRAKKPFSDELLCLAGLQRVEYLFAYPDQRDIVIAGPAEGWKVDAVGALVGKRSGLPVLRLEDLLEALRTAEEVAFGAGITCSIDPTKEGLVKLQRALRAIRVNRGTARRLEKTLGSQIIRVKGVQQTGHFARVMVAADLIMKRLAMGLEKAPVDKFPSYLQLLQAEPNAVPKGTVAPRWWLASNYEPIARSQDGLAWQIRGPGIQAKTEDGALNEDGQIIDTGEQHPLAQKWAHLMTRHYPKLSQPFPVFAELRNCMDLAVIAAIVLKEDLCGRVEWEMPLLLNPHLAGAKYAVPRQVSSQASLVRVRSGWLTSVSGGVRVDSWPVLNKTVTQQATAEQRQQARRVAATSWWWD